MGICVIFMVIAFIIALVVSIKEWQFTGFKPPAWALLVLIVLAALRTVDEIWSDRR